MNRLTNGQLCKGTKINVTHGMCGTRFYRIWKNMKSRCLNPNTPSYTNYGSRGISICNAWIAFEEFYDDMYVSYLESVALNDESGTTIERINNDECYCKENCVWATRKQQCRNKRNTRVITYNNKTQSLAEWADELNLPYHTLKDRIYKLKWEVKKAFTVKHNFRLIKRHR